MVKITKTILSKSASIKNYLSEPERDHHITESNHHKWYNKLYREYDGTYKERIKAN